MLCTRTPGGLATPRRPEEATVLLVEDEDALRDITRLVLTAAGYR